MVGDLGIRACRIAADVIGAVDVGLDIAAFIGHLNDGSAEAAFREDLATTRRCGERGFPTLDVSLHSSAHL